MLLMTRKVGKSKSMEKLNSGNLYRSFSPFYTNSGKNNQENNSIKKAKMLYFCRYLTFYIIICYDCVLHLTFVLGLFYYCTTITKNNYQNWTFYHQIGWKSKKNINETLHIKIFDNLKSQKEVNNNKQHSLPQLKDSCL